MKILFLLSVFVLFCATFCGARIIATENFTPTEIKTTENGKEYLQYIIKYGQITDGEWFKPATSVSEQVNDVRCPHWHEQQQQQLHNLEFEAFKDCLILKIETNDLSSNKPVMVYIPGFDLSSGDIKSTSGHYLLDKDVVLVTVQYRVGILGFLSTKTEEIPGNAGVLDVILALKWIQNHISQFGGDPNRVTLFGNYKAAGLIGILTMNPLAEGLFHQIIYHSGHALLSNLTTTNPLDFARKVAQEINCTAIEKPIDLNKCILNAKFSDLLEAHHKLMLKYDGEISPITIGGPSNVLPDDMEPSDLIDTETFRKYPTMGGVVDHPQILLLDAYNEKEYSRFSIKYFQEEFSDKMDNSTPKVENKSSEEEESEAVKEIMNTMIDFAKTLIKGLVVAFLPLEIDLSGMEIKTDMVKILTKNKEAGVPSYLYAFKYRGSMHYFPKKEGSWLKNYVTLLDDNVFLFDSDKVLSDDDKQINKIMIDLWTSFAENGKPQTDLINIKWPQINDSDGPYLIIDMPVKIGNDFSKELTPLVDCQNEGTCEWIDESIGEN